MWAPFYGTEKDTGLWEIRKRQYRGRSIRRTNHGPADIVTGGEKVDVRKNSVIIWLQKSKKENCPASRDAVKAVPMESICRASVTVLQLYIGK